MPIPSSPRDRVEIAPGCVHVPDFLGRGEQEELVARCREWAAGPVPMSATRLPSGGLMSVRTVCLGWHWSPYRYTRTATLASGATVPVAPFPASFTDLGRRALASAYGAPDETYCPDTALINFYDAAAKMGLHQDKDERSPAPVVSLSLGDSCVFRFGNPETRGKPWTDIELRSGDLVVFGGSSRWAYHGVPKILGGTSDLMTGRLNITLRETGL